MQKIQESSLKYQRKGYQGGDKHVAAIQQVHMCSTVAIAPCVQCDCCGRLLDKGLHAAHVLSVYKWVLQVLCPASGYSLKRMYFA